MVLYYIRLHRSPRLLISRSGFPSCLHSSGKTSRLRYHGIWFRCKKSGYFTKPVKNITNRIFICHKQVNNDTKSNSYSSKRQQNYFCNGTPTAPVLQKGQDTSLLMVFLALDLILPYKVFSLRKVG